MNINNNDNNLESIAVKKNTRASKIII
jgi:hypothetical protein